MAFSPDIYEETPTFVGVYDFEKHHPSSSIRDSQEYGYNIRLFEHSIGRVALIGHCTSPDEVVNDALDNVAGDPARLTYLDGSYVTVIERPEEMTIYADLAGQFPIYFGEYGKVMLISTSSEAAAKPHATLPSMHGLAAGLIGEVSPVGWCPSSYRGVSRLPGGHKLRLTPNGAEVSPYDSLAPDLEMTQELAIQNVRRALHGALASRIGLGKMMTSDFSGGSDSTSLAFLAANISPTADKMHVFHGNYHGGGTSGDALVAAKLIELTNKLEMHVIDMPPESVVNPDAASRRVLYGAIKDHLQGASAIHLTGTGGDALLHTPSMHLLDMWRNKRIRDVPRFTKDLIAQATLVHADPLKMLSRIREMAAISYEQSLQAVGEGLPGGIRQNAWLLIDSPAIQLLGTRGMEGLRDIMIARRQALPHPALGIADFRAITDMQTSGLIAARTRHQAAQFGISLHAPYLDHAVIRACFDMPARDRYDARQFKVVLAKALEQDVPTEIFARTTKGDTIAEVYADLREHADELRVILGTNSHLARMGIIDPRAVRLGIARVEAGLKNSPTNFIAKALALEGWLQANYELPAPKRSPKSTIVSEIQLPDSFTFPPYVKLVRDEGGLVMYNLQNKLLRSIHTRSAKAIEQIGPDSQPKNAFARQVVANLLTEGFLVAGQYQPFEITEGSPQDKTFEAKVHLDQIDTSDITIRDYKRMANALMAATRILKKHSLWGVVQALPEYKKDMPLADVDSASRLLKAGHAIGRFCLTRTACQELSLAVVLAEAKAGRAVDWCIGTAPDPRRIHAWPQINGVPVQTVYDEMSGAGFTPFGTW